MSNSEKDQESTQPPIPESTNSEPPVKEQPVLSEEEERKALLKRIKEKIKKRGIKL